MQNGSKQSGAKVTGLLSGRFHRARVKLTLIYVAILVVILFVSSYTIYANFSGRLDHRYEGYRPAYNVQLFPDAPAFSVPSPADVQEDLVHTLVIVNGVLLAIAALASYWLAGITLQPIQESFDRQKRFLGDASHELRTPLTILQMDLENNLEDPKLKAEAKEQAKSHLEEVERMGKLVSDLLTLSRMDEEMEVKKTNMTMVDVNSILTQMVARFSSLAEHNKVSLNYEQIGDQNKLRTDPELFQQVVGNIIKNAISYNKAGGKVNIITKQTAVEAVIEITDTGIGISKADISRISERFYRAEKSRSRQTGGSGLGLSIVQSALDRLGGSMEIKSRLGEGTTVQLHFPQRQSS